MPVAAAANALAKVADVKYMMGRPQIDTSYDDRIQTIINLLSARTEDWCGRRFTRATYTAEAYDGVKLRGSYNLLLYNYPLVSVASLTIDTVVIDPSRYVVYTKEGYIYYPFGWGMGSQGLGAHQNVLVTYDAGYDPISAPASNPMPGGLTLACVEWAIMLIKERQKDAKVVQAASAPPPEQVAAALAPYKRTDF